MSTSTIKTCSGYTSDGSSGQAYSQARHDLPNDTDHFSPGKSQCRDCYRAYAADWRAKRGTGSTTGTTRRRSQAAPTVTIPDLRAPVRDADLGEDGEVVSDDDLATGSHAYVASVELLEVWAAITNAAAAGRPAANLLFLGDKGCGKTEGAHFLAGTVGLPFVKVDAPSMTDPESWFGTREVINEDGVSVTTYKPSTFALMLEQPCVMLIDEMNRAKDSDRNILLPVLDKTRRVTNPLTGDVIHRHPKCFIIMSGNRGLGFTGTYAVDPAFMSRALTVEFRYVDAAAETQIAIEATGCDLEIAELFVKFATATRERARLEPDFEPMSTREVIEACGLVKFGASIDSAARAVVIAAASPEGQESSQQAALEILWTGVRTHVAPTTRACGFEHPYQHDANGDQVTCEVEVPIATATGASGHLANPQHKGTLDGAPVVWFDQP